MNRLDVFNRIRRTFLCKKRNWYRRQWNKLQPMDFYKDPERMTSLWYALNAGHLPNLKHPHNFNELLMSFNMQAYRDPQKRELFIRCADKYAVRQYITDKGYADILNECYGVYESFDAIDFDTLPNQFVLKMTTGSGMNFICKDKSTLDIDALRKRVKTWFEDVKTCGLKTAEWHYVEITPRLIIEKYLHQLGEDISLVDYKFHCFNGRIYGEDVMYDRNLLEGTSNDDLYDPDWNRTEATLPQYHLTRRLLQKPIVFERMKKIASDLSAGIDYVRVDLYCLEDKILFGELTFTPVGCYEYDYRKEYLEDMCQFYYKTKQA